MVQTINDIPNAVGSGTFTGRDAQFLKQVVWASWAIIVAAAVYQIIFFFDVTNLTGIVAVMIAWFITTRIWLRTAVLEKYLISTFTILGFASTQFYFPLLFTTLENKPLIFNLDVPEQVFLHSSLCLLVLVIAHALYRLLKRFSLNRSVSFFDKAGFFQPPTHLQVWLMGFIGMAASFYVFYTSPDIGREVTGASSDKLLQGLVPFSYAPFFIPLSRMYGNKEKLPKGFTLVIVLYSILLFAMSMARNSRGAFIFGLTSPVFGYGLGLLLGVFKTRILTIRNVVVVGLGTWILLGPFTDLGTAMLLVRDQRTDISPGELISLTLEAMDDKKAIQARKDSDKDESMDFDWDERYLDNLFTARFANIKFNDSNFQTYQKIGQYDPDMQEFSLDQLISALPDPVIKLFNFQVDKETVLSMSFGDYQYILSGGNGTPFGFRVGHIAGSGMATFGWWYLFIFGVMVIPMFYVNDKLFRRKKGAALAEAQFPEDRFQLSFCGVLALTTFFQFFGIESVVQGATYLMRGWIQMIFLYFFIFHLCRILSLAFNRKKLRFRFREINA